MATAKTKAAPTAKKAAPRKNVTKSVSKVKAAPVTALEIPAPMAKTRKRTAHKFSYTGKLAAETKPQTPQFVACLLYTSDAADE